MKLPAPDFGGRRLLLVGTGAASALHLPFWANWLASTYPELAVRVILTPSAERFTTRAALGLLTGSPAIADRWPEEDSGGALHVRLREWADCALVYPASLNYIARLANGMGDSPSLLALQCSSAPIAVAPALPAGGIDNPLIAGNLARVTERPNVLVAPTREVRSLTTGRRDPGGLAPMWTVLEGLEGLRSALASGSAPADGAGTDPAGGPTTGGDREEPDV